MKLLTVPEYGRIPRSSMPARLLDRLQAFDERHLRHGGDSVFDWGFRDHVRAKSIVGVVQVPGLTIQVVPKVDSSPGVTEGPLDPADPLGRRAQSNLLYMLSLTRRVPLQEQDLGDLRLERMPLLDALIAVFADRLLGELRRGVDRAYLHQEENLRVYRGKLRVAEHIRLNCVHRERVFVAYDELVEDTWLNRILKATSVRLRSATQAPGNVRKLSEILLRLADVSDESVRPHHFDQVHLNRQTERFSVLLGFARLVLLSWSPAPTSGEQETFSLVFPMEVLFEEFIARFIRRHQDALGLADATVHAQAEHQRRWLLETPEGSGRFRLRPDIVICSPDGRPRLILDTKWKRLRSDEEDSKNGVSQADIYQLFAYAERYRCPDNVLLYPSIAGVTAKEYHVPNHEAPKRLRIGFVDLSADLRRDPGLLMADLRKALRPGSS